MVQAENPQQVHVKEENTMVYIYLNFNFRWLKHSGISFGSERKHHALCRELIGDNLEVELAPFSFKLADGGEEIGQLMPIHPASLQRSPNFWNRMRCMINPLDKLKSIMREHYLNIAPSMSAAVPPVEKREKN